MLKKETMEKMLENYEELRKEQMIFTIHASLTDVNHLDVHIGINDDAANLLNIVYGIKKSELNTILDPLTEQVKKSMTTLCKLIVERNDFKGVVDVCKMEAN